jgi:hypothetical protein
MVYDQCMGEQTVAPDANEDLARRVKELLSTLEGAT